MHIVRELRHIGELYLCPTYNAIYIHHIHTSQTPKFARELPFEVPCLSFKFLYPKLVGSFVLCCIFPGIIIITRLLSDDELGAPYHGFYTIVNDY